MWQKPRDVIDPSNRLRSLTVRSVTRGQESCETWILSGSSAGQAFRKNKKTTLSSSWVISLSLVKKQMCSHELRRVFRFVVYFKSKP